jgi:hypothetical protein
MNSMRILALLMIFSWQGAEASERLHRIAVISDLNGSYGSTRYGEEVRKAVERLREMKPDVVLATGDLVAGQKAGLDYRAMWRSFHENVTRPLRDSGIPLAVTVGNHDGSAYSRFLEERKIFEDEWKSYLPAVEYSDLEQYPFFYSFTLGDLLFISIDSTRVGPRSAKELAWIEKELLKHARQKMVFFLTHVPLFHFAEVPEGESYYDPGLIDLLNRFGVRFYLSGHHHSFFPGFASGTHFVSQACLGAGPTRLQGAAVRSAKSFTVIDLYEDHFEIDANEAPLFLGKVDVKGLPRSIGTGMRRLELKDRGER